MLALAGIGAFATLKGVPGHPVSAQATPIPSGGAHVENAIGPGPPAESLKLLPASHATTTSAPSTAAPEKAPSPGVTADGKVILNLAAVEDLLRLPGVGRKRAEAILALRAKLGGRFRRVTDLLRIRGIGTRRLKQLTPLLILDAPAPLQPQPSARENVPAPTPRRQ